MTGAPVERDAVASPRPLLRGAAALWEADSVTRRASGVVAMVAVLYVIAVGRPGIAMSGRGLAILLLAVAASALFLAWSAMRRMTLTTAAVTLMGLGVIGGVLGALTAPGLMFPFVAVFSAGRRLPYRTAMVCLVATVLAFGITGITAGRLEYLSVIGLSMGLVAATLGGLNAAAHRRVREQAELIVAEGQVIAEERARSAALAERARITREIHDVLAHSLSGLMVQLEAAHLLLQREADPATVSDHVDRARRLARSGLDETRRALRALREEPLPIGDVVAELVDSYRADTGCPATLTVSGDARPLSADVGVTVRRVAQEALTNVRRHAPGARVDVDIIYEDGAVRLTVTDHPPAGSVAPPLSDVGSGYGLVGMRERAELLGGQLSVGPTADGWRVSLRVPT